jgi:hypothetical protein
MELSFVRSEEQMRTQVELQPADVERLKKQADEFDRQVRLTWKGLESGRIRRTNVWMASAKLLTHESSQGPSSW